MDVRTVGDTKVPPLGMGCWAIGGPFWSGDKPSGWGEVDDEESAAALRRALDLGISFFDTADVYGTGHSERMLGKAVAGRRGDVFLATKWGNIFDEESRRITAQDPGAAQVRKSVEASLRRLDTEYIDLYQWHLGGASPDQAAGVREVLELLVAEGKIRFYGWSTDDPERPEAMAGPHFAAVAARTERAQRRPPDAGRGGGEGLGQHQPRSARHGSAESQVHGAEPTRP